MSVRNTPRSLSRRLISRAVEAVESLESRRLFAYAYTLTDLAPDVAGKANPTGTAYGISNNGTVAMEVNGHAAIWKGGILTDLGISGYATDVNDSGTVVGVDTTGGTNKPFVYANGTETLLKFQGHTTGSANAINSKGDVVGTFTNYDAHGNSAAFELTGGNIGTLGAPQGANNASVRATGINDSGEIIGNVIDATTGLTQAFFDNKGVFTYAKPTPGGNETTTAHGITNGGLMAYDGASNDLYTDGSTKIYHVYVTTANANDSRDDYGTLGNDYDISATDINARSEITATINGGATPFEAAIASGGYGFTSLTSLIDPNTGWSLFAANAINDSGQIVGYGYNSTGEMKPYLLTRTPQSEVEGTIYNDFNKDRNRDPGEATAGVHTVFLDANDNGKLDAGERSTQTDANGHYDFNDLPDGSYRLGVQLPAGQYLTDADDGKTTIFFPLDIKEHLHFDVGYAAATPAGTFTLSGVAFSDANKDGQLSNKEEINPGQTVFLDKNANGQLDAGETSVVTDANGVYHFDGLSNGSYQVTPVLPAGFGLTNGTGGANLRTVTVNGAAQGDIDLAEAVAPVVKKGTVSGVLFNDSNNNGKFDRGETVTGVRTVFIDANGNGLLDRGELSVQSDAAGRYTFNNVGPGTIKIGRVFPKGFQLSNPTVGTTFNVVVNVSVGKVTVADLGTHEIPKPPSGKFGEISGTLFNDTNNNGKFDKSESPSGVRTVYLDENRNGKLDAGEYSVQSDAAGHYELNRTPIGLHAVSRVFPAGYHLSNPSDGTGGNDVLVTVLGNINSVVDLGTHENAK